MAHQDGLKETERDEEEEAVWNFKVPTDKQLLANPPDTVVVDKEQ